MCEPGLVSTLGSCGRRSSARSSWPRARGSCSRSSAASGCRRGSSSRPTTTRTDLRLARHGVTFRHRVEDGAGLWQLKLPRGAGAGSSSSCAGRRRGPRPSWSACCRRISAAASSSPSPASVRGARASGPQGAEIVDDNVAVLEGQRVARRFREVEVELLDGDERTLRRLEKELRKAGAACDGRVAAQALSRARPGRRRRAPDVTKGMPPGEALGIALEREYRALLAHDPGTRRGDDPEDLHQLRVATRRLRAFLRAARRLVDGDWARSLRAELGWLGGHLGPARDLDVCWAASEPRSARLGGDADRGVGPARGARGGAGSRVP